jgi:4-amino-4-deoxy-L-arabinose transferase-like glycosyltransferase
MRRDIALWFAFAVFALHLATATGYGIFRDEYYYLACADHLAWGYVDHPPFSIAFLAAWKALFGDSALALRIPPAILHGLVVWWVAVLAQRMGAGTLGRATAAACAGLAGGLLGMCASYSMNAFDLAAWVGLALIFERILHEGGPRWWITFGVVLGLGLLNKYSVGVLGFGLGLGLLASPARRDLMTRWPWVAVAITLVLLAPHVVWQAVNDWPTREFIANAQAEKITRVSPAEFLLESWLEALPPSVMVWLPGLLGLLFWPRLREWRAFGIAWVAAFVVFNVQVSKPYYLNAAYPMIFAAGGAVWTAIGTGRRTRAVAVGVLVTVVACGLFFSPYAIPVLPPETFVRYTDMVGIEPGNAENTEAAPMPQHLADRFGWKELTETVARVYESLPPEDQKSCLIVGQNYGEAGALLYHGRALGLPPAVSQHNSFYTWGPGGDHFDVVIVVGQGREELGSVFESVVEAARYDDPWAMPFERNLPIWVCRGWKRPVAEIWRAGRFYI